MLFIVFLAFHNFLGAPHTTGRIFSPQEHNCLNVPAGSKALARIASASAVQCISATEASGHHARARLLAG